MCFPTQKDGRSYDENILPLLQLGPCKIIAFHKSIFKYVFSFQNFMNSGTTMWTMLNWESSMFEHKASSVEFVAQKAYSASCYKSKNDKNTSSSAFSLSQSFSIAA